MWQVGLDVADAIGATPNGNAYAAKWPKKYKHVIPDTAYAQSVQDAYRWPERAKQNLERLKEELKEGEAPALLSGKTFTVTSSFAGLCSQSRASRILEHHGFGCSFHHALGSGFYN